MDSNWMALFACIVSEKRLGVTAALKRFGITSKYKKNKIVINDSDFCKITEMKNKKIKWQVIAESVGCKESPERLRDKYYNISNRKKLQRILASDSM